MSEIISRGRPPLEPAARPGDGSAPSAPTAMRRLAAALLAIAGLALGGAAGAETLSLAEVVLFGLRPTRELDVAAYRPEGRACVEVYLAAAARVPRLRDWKPPAGPEQAQAARRRNLEAQPHVYLPGVGRP